MTTKPSKAKKKLKIKDVLQPSTELKAGKRSRGRPPSKKTIEAIDLAALKQSMLLDNVEQLIEDKQVQEAMNQGVKELLVPYTPNTNQQELHALLRQYRYAVVVVHRGFGKTWLAMNELIRRAWECTKRDGGVFAYIAPEKLQAKYVAWDKLKVFVQNLPVTIHEADLSITFPNNSVIRLYGADNPHRIRGQHFSYIVLDEVGQMPSDIWTEACYPALQANKGGALFIGTPKGENFFKEIYDSAKGKDNWLAFLKPVTETTVFSPEQIKEFLIEQGEQKFEQEYLCSFEAGMQGSFFDYLFASEELNLVGDVPWNPDQPVITAWDIGINDPTSIWFIQRDSADADRFRVIDFYEAAHPDFMTHLKAVLAKPYLYAEHYMPHDINKRIGLGTLTRYELCLKNGLKVKIASKEVKPEEGIAMVQRLLPRCRFDLNKCKAGITHLKSYSSKQDRMTGEFLKDAVHDKHSHAADAFRYLAVGLRKSHGQDAKHLAYAISAYDYFSPSTAGRTNDEADYEYDPFNIP